ncbi:hypothetical protein [Megamonas sp.]
MVKYTDGKYIYYVSALLGDKKYAVCKKEIGAKNFGNHKYKSSANKTVQTKGEAQDYLDRLAERKGWQEY